MTESMIARLARAVTDCAQHADPNDTATRHELMIWAGIAQPTDEAEQEQDVIITRTVQERIARRDQN